MRKNVNRTFGIQKKMELRGKNKIQQRTFNEINGVFSPMAVCANLRIANDNFVPFLRNAEIKKPLYILTFFFRFFC